MGIPTMGSPTYTHGLQAKMKESPESLLATYLNLLALSTPQHHQLHYPIPLAFPYHPPQHQQDLKCSVHLCPSLGQGHSKAQGTVEPMWTMMTSLNEHERVGDDLS